MFFRAHQELAFHSESFPTLWKADFHPSLRSPGDFHQLSCFQPEPVVVIGQQRKHLANRICFLVNIIEPA